MADERRVDETVGSDRQPSLDSCGVKCVVPVSPKISRPPLSAHVTEGEDAMFDCQLSATPWPVTVVTWTFNQQPISVSSLLLLFSLTLGRYIPEGV